MTKTLAEELRERAYERKPVDGLLAICAVTMEELSERTSRMHQALTLIAEWAETVDEKEVTVGLVQTARIARDAIQSEEK